MSVGLMVGFSLLLRFQIIELRRSYDHLSMRHLSPLTDTAMSVGPFLWLIAMLLALEGARRIHYHPVVNALNWCHLFFVVFVALSAVLGYSLVQPFFLVTHPH